MDPFFSLLIGMLGGGVIGVLFAPFHEPFVAFIHGRSGVLSGKWEEMLPASELHKSYDRRDHLTVRHNDRTGLITVHVRRTSPLSEAGNEWRMRGYLRGHDAFLLYWSDGKRADPDSFGFLILRPDPHSIDRWLGHYWRPANENPRLRNSLKKLDVEWIRRNAKRDKNLSSTPGLDAP